MVDQCYCWTNWPKYTAKIADHKLHELNESALDTTLSHYTNYYTTATERGKMQRKM